MDNGGSQRPRVYLPDTNVLINDPDSLTKLARGNMVVVPYPVVRELDQLKDSLNGVGMAARRVARMLDTFQEGKPFAALSKGIAMPEGGCLVFDDNLVPADDSWDGFDPRNNDDRIISIARKWTRHRPDARVSLVTRDVAMRVKARPLGVDAEDYRDDKKISSVDELYPGAATITIPDGYHGLLTDLHRESRLEASRVLSVSSSVTAPRQPVLHDRDRVERQGRARDLQGGPAGLLPARAQARQRARHRADERGAAVRPRAALRPGHPARHARRPGRVGQDPDGAARRLPPAPRELRPPADLPAEHRDRPVARLPARARSRRSSRRGRGRSSTTWSWCCAASHAPG